MSKVGIDHTPRSDEEIAARVKALEAILIEKGLMSEAGVDRFAEIYEKEVGPQLGAKVIAKAWLDSEYKSRLLKDATSACKELGIGGLQGEHMVALENTDSVHNVVVCSLCSCYPWPVLGLPPNWYKSIPYRARMTREPRACLKEDFGLDLPDDVEIRVWDSNSEIRYWMIPKRPQGTDGMSEEALAGLVTRDSMIGTGLAQAPK